MGGNALTFIIHYSLLVLLGTFHYCTSLTDASEFSLQWTSTESRVTKLFHNSFRSHIFAVLQNEDVLSGAQDRLCSGPLSLHGRVQSSAGGVWRADKEQSSGCHSFGPCVQVFVDLCRGVLHGVLPDPLRCLSEGQTGKCLCFYFIECVIFCVFLIQAAVFIHHWFYSSHVWESKLHNSTTDIIFLLKVNYIVSDSEFHILNSWRQEDQSTHEVISYFLNTHRTTECLDSPKLHWWYNFSSHCSSCQLWQLLGHQILVRIQSAAAFCMA